MLERNPSLDVTKANLTTRPCSASYQKKLEYSFRPSYSAKRASIQTMTSEDSFLNSPKPLKKEEPAPRIMDIHFKITAREKKTPQNESPA